MLPGIAVLHMRMAFVSSELIPGIWGSAVAALPARELGSSLICRGVQVVKTAPVLTGAGPLRAGEMLSSGHKASTGYTNLCVLLQLSENLTIFDWILQAKIKQGWAALYFWSMVFYQCLALKKTGKASIILKDFLATNMGKCHILAEERDGATDTILILTGLHLNSPFPPVI